MKKNQRNMTIPKNHDTLAETNHKGMKTYNSSHKEIVVLTKFNELQERKTME